MSKTEAAGRLSTCDLFSTAILGMRTRKLRAVLSALGVAIGMASIVAVVCLSQSSKAGLLAELDRLGTNLLEVTPGTSALGDISPLPSTALPMIKRIEAVYAASSVEELNASVTRTDQIPPELASGATVMTADLGLVGTLQTAVANGTWLNEATARYPVAVLGAVAAGRLGISSVYPGLKIRIDNHWFGVTGILQTIPLAPEIDRAVLIGQEVGRQLFQASDSATAIYVRAIPERALATSELLAPTAKPQAPSEVQVSRPSDALAARAAAKGALTSLFLGLAAVALIVGGIGIANVMVISVLERRTEIGLRRALGATRKHIGLQFLTEALVLAGVGGLIGVTTGSLVTLAYAALNGWQPVIPLEIVLAAFGLSLALGALAGIYPALRAARLAPFEALRSA